MTDDERRSPEMNDGQSTELDGSEPGPIDLGAIDPTRDSVRFDRAIAHLRERARPELERRSRAAAWATGSTSGWLRTLPESWGRVAWPAAAAIALASFAILQTRDAAMGATVEEALAHAVGVPEVLAPWMNVQEAPALSQILVGWEDDE
jgi:hypothetical protein